MSEGSSTAYSIDEVFGIAEEIERNGAAFYRDAIDVVESAEASELFLSLAKQEDHHARTFAMMRKVMVDQGRGTTDDSDETVARYLRAISDQYIFERDKRPEELFDADASLEDIVDIAMGKEKDSIVLYLGIRDAMREHEERPKVDRIIREEQKHLVDLSFLLTEQRRKKGPPAA